MWAHKGYIYWIDPHFQLEALVNGYPKSVELFAFIVIRATGLDELTNTLNLMFLPFGILGLAGPGAQPGSEQTSSPFQWDVVGANSGEPSSNPRRHISILLSPLWAIAYLALVVAAQQNLHAPQGASPGGWCPLLGAAAGLTLAAKGSAALLVLAGLAGSAVAGLVARIAGGQARQGLFGAPWQRQSAPG